MAILLAWINWDEPAPDPAIWQALQQRARERAPGAAVQTLSLPGVRVAAWRTRALAPAPMLQGDDGVLLLRDLQAEADSKSLAQTPQDTPAAVIVIDPAKRQVVLLRDRLGQRPLYFATVGSGLLVASGADVLRAHPGVDDALDERYLDAYFGLCALPAEVSAFRAIAQVPPGHRLQWTDGRFSATSLDYQPLDGAWRWDDARIGAELRTALGSAVASATEGSARIGMLLSAGVDSAALAALIRAQSATPRTVVALTYGPEQWAGFNEREDAAELADWCGFEHCSLVSDGLGPLAEAGRRRVSPDQPLSNPYRELKTAAHERLAAAGVDVVIAGYGADQLAADRNGWLRDAVALRRWDLILANHRHAWASDGWRGLWQERGWRAWARRLTLGEPLIGPAAWLRAPVASRLRERHQQELAQWRQWPRPRQAIHNLGGFAAHDGAGEAYHSAPFGFEMRLPYRSWPLIQLCLSLPAFHSWREGNSKSAMRATLAPVLPERWRLRPKSGSLALYGLGLGRAWPRVEPLIRRGEPVWADIVEPAAVHQALTAPTRTDAQDMLIWQLLALGLWLERLQT
jgi:asparagine synthetase B (glutamine-hydrolysing)